MSQLIQLKDGCWIDPDLVAEVTRNELANTLTVRMHDGIGHSVPPDYGQSVYSTQAALVKKINDARTQ